MSLASVATAAAAVLALAAPSSAQALTPTITEHPLPPTGQPYGVDAGPDGALWFTTSSGNSIGRMTTDGAATEYPLPSAKAQPWNIAAGPDGAMWFTEATGNRIGRVTMAGAITEFPVLTPYSSPNAIVAGPDGNQWFTEVAAGMIGRITPGGTVTEFPLPTSWSQPRGITAGPDGNLWAVESAANKLARITPAGVVTEFSAPTGSAGLFDIAAGPDGNLWFPEYSLGRIGRITPGGVSSEFGLPNGSSQPLMITAGPDDALWFTELGANAIGRITTAGSVSEHPLPTPNASPAAIARGADGNIWFTEATAGSLGRITTPPGVGTVAPSGLQDTAATITATVDAHAQGTTVRVEYGPTSAYDAATADQPVPTGTADRTVQTDVAGLSPGTGYHYRVVAVNGTGTSSGSDQLFTTTGDPPTTPSGASPPRVQVGRRSAVISGASVVMGKDGAAPIGVGCPVTAVGGCRGRVVLRLSSPPARAKAKTGKVTGTAARCARGCRPLGEAKFDARSGTTKQVRVRLSAGGRKLLAHAGKLKVRVTVVLARSGGGTPVTSSKTIVVRARA